MRAHGNYEGGVVSQNVLFLLALVERQELYIVTMGTTTITMMFMGILMKAIRYWKRSSSFTRDL